MNGKNNRLTAREEADSSELKPFGMTNLKVDDPVELRPFKI
jgi:hypothetical protein